MEFITKDSKKGTGNYNYTVNEGDRVQQVEVWNDSETATLTYVADGKMFTVLPGDVSSETFISFRTVSITATGDWRLIIRGR
jgi:hypothetical protein